jgi:hypothetical protein
VREALRVAIDFADRPGAAGALVAAAHARLVHAPLDAARWLAAAETAYLELGKDWEPLEAQMRNQAVETLDPAVLDHARTQATQQPLEEVAEEAADQLSATG